MKKNYMKLFLAGLMILAGFSFSSCNGDDDNEIENSVLIKDLPAEAQTFLNSFFPGIGLKKAEKQQIQTVVMYEVELENGFDIMFNSEGVWQEVDAPEGKTIPSGIAPQPIEEYVNQNYSDYGINEINKTGNGYNVEVNNGPELEFNQLGEFVRVISDF